MLQAVQHSAVSIPSMLPPPQELHGTLYREVQMVIGPLSSARVLFRAVRSVVTKFVPYCFHSQHFYSLRKLLLLRLCCVLM